MAQHDYVIDNAAGASVRSDLNAVLEAIATTNSGSGAPSTLYQGQMWIDTNTPSATVWTLYAYDGTDHIALGQIDTTNNVFLHALAGATLSGTTTNSGTISGGAVNPDSVVVTSTSDGLTAKHSTGNGVRLRQTGASGAAELLNRDNGDLGLGANNALFAWLVAGGYINIGSNSPVVSSGFLNVTHSSSRAALTSHNTDSSGAGQSSVIFARNSSTVGAINTNATTTAYVTSSDARIKEDVEGLGEVGAIIDALAPKTWAWKYAPDAPRGVGFIAQEVFDLVPEAVAEGDDDMGRERGDEGYREWAMDPAKLVPYLVAELKSVRARLAALEAAA